MENFMTANEGKEITNYETLQKQIAQQFREYF